MRGRYLTNLYGSNAALRVQKRPGSGAILLLFLHRADFFNMYKRVPVHNGFNQLCAANVAGRGLSSYRKNPVFFRVFSCFLRYAFHFERIFPGRDK
jgi:hypothetical protein